jgi:predicted acylesterase/phospholipase RssA
MGRLGDTRLGRHRIALPERILSGSIRYRTLCAHQIDFERLTRLKRLKLFVVATHVSTGRAEVFTGKRLTASAVMASACLPMMFQAVEIDGEHYWDGGYAGNPAIHPLDLPMPKPRHHAGADQPDPA